MVEIEIAVPAGVDVARVTKIVEEAAGSRGLSVTMRGSLAAYPGSMHWHFKLGKQLGTLEATLWPSGLRLWLSIQSGRTAPWVEATAHRLKSAIEARLRP